MALKVSVNSVSVKVRVTGKNRATVVQDENPPVIVEGDYDGAPGEGLFYLTHPYDGDFTITEEAVVDAD